MANNKYYDELGKLLGDMRLGITETHDLKVRDKWQKETQRAIKKLVDEMVKEIIGDDVKPGTHVHVNYHNNMLAQQRQIARERGIEI